MERRPSLQDLPQDALLQLFAALPSLQDKLRLAASCKRLRAIGDEPSLWRSVSFTCKLNSLRRLPRADRLQAALAHVNGFRRWLEPRLPFVDSLSFCLMAPEPLPLQAGGGRQVMLPQMLLCDSRLAGDGDGGSKDGSGSGSKDGSGSGSRGGGGSPSAPLPLTSITIEWPGTAFLVFPASAGAGTGQGGEAAQRLPRLRRLAFAGGTTLEVPPPGFFQQLFSSKPPASLEEFALCDGAVLAQQEAWLPPSVASLALSGAALRRMPPLLAHLPSLRSLSLATNRLTGAPLDPLERLAPTLQELNLSETYLAAFPSQLSCLTNLRVLYLHDAFHRTARVRPADWEALRPLGRLAFLSISSNHLRELPAAVGGMTQLRGLHLEGNEFEGGLPPAAACLAGLRELLLDWQCALESSDALRYARCLTRLVLSGHRAADACAAREGRWKVAPASSAEPLLSALAAMPALRRVEDVFVGGEDVVTVPVAAVMWRLGARCPHLAVGLLQDANVGWALADAEAAEAAGGGAAGQAAAGAAAGAAGSAGR